MTPAIGSDRVRRIENQRPLVGAYTVSISGQRLYVAAVRMVLAGIAVSLINLVVG